MNFKTCKFNNNLFSDSARAVAVSKYAKNFLGYAEFDGVQNQWHGDSVLIYAISKKEWLAVVTNQKKATFFFCGDKKKIQAAQDMKTLVQIASAVAVNDADNSDDAASLREERSRIQAKKNKEMLSAIRGAGGFGYIFVDHPKFDLTEEELNRQDLGETFPLI